VRYAAVRVAGRLFAVRPGDEPLDDRLGDGVIAALNDRDEPIREEAMWALGAMRNDRAARGLGELFRYYRKGTLAVASFSAMAQIAHATSVPEFIEQMRAKDAVFRALAIDGFARTGDRNWNEAIHAAIGRERNRRVMLAAHFANAMLANGAVETIVESLDDNMLREQAMQYVTELAVRRPEAFVHFVQDAKLTIRVGVIDALGLSGQASAAPALRSARLDPDPDVQRAVARALARLGA
jgi:HEAT repeat protein